MNRNNKMMLKELMELDLKMYDLQLFLNTHPFESRAVAEYNTTANKYISMKQHYEKLYGPLTIDDKDDNTTPWQWIDGPWPWQYQKEKEEMK